MALSSLPPFTLKPGDLGAGGCRRGERMLPPCSARPNPRPAGISSVDFDARKTAQNRPFILHYLHSIEFTGDRWWRISGRCPCILHYPPPRGGAHLSWGATALDYAERRAHFSATSPFRAAAPHGSPRPAGISLGGL